jgi:bifunctional non-homologous end joining protein LigD
MLAVCLTLRRCSSKTAQLIFYAFDLLYLGGKDLREKPLLERRNRLRELLGRDSDSRIQFSEEFIGDLPPSFAPVPRMS